MFQSRSKVHREPSMNPLWTLHEPSVNPPCTPSQKPGRVHTDTHERFTEGTRQRVHGRCIDDIRAAHARRLECSWKVHERLIEGTWKVHRVHRNSIWRLQNSFCSWFRLKIWFYLRLRVIRTFLKITNLSFLEEHERSKKVRINKILTVNHTFNRGSQALLKITQIMNSETQKYDS